jgi:hypothetical protein
MLLALSLSGVVAGANILTATGPAQETADPEVVVDTTATFEDTNGNGVDDDCEEAVVADPGAEAVASTAVDLDGDGEISVSEAAQSERTGGLNCNHGGYVSLVADGDDDEEATEEAAPAAVEDCEEVAAPLPDPAVTTPNAHGAWISAIAQSDATGGKNCNHGGAVSEANEAAKAAREAAKAERDAAKAERAADRAAAKADREAARAERTAAKAAKPAKAQGKGH